MWLPGNEGFEHPISRPSKAQRFTVGRNCVLLLGPILTVESSHNQRALCRVATASCAQRKRARTQSLVLLPKRPHAPVQLFDSTSAKNSPVLNPSGSTATQVKAPQNALSGLSSQLQRLQVSPPEHYKKGKVHNKIIRVVAERGNQKIKGPFEICVWSVTTRNGIERRAKVPASSCVIVKLRWPNAKDDSFSYNLPSDVVNVFDSSSVPFC